MLAHVTTLYLTQVLAHLQTYADLKVLDLLLKLVAQDCPLGVISVSLQRHQSGLHTHSMQRSANAISGTELQRRNTIEGSCSCHVEDSGIHALLNIIESTCLYNQLLVQASMRYRHKSQINRVELRLKL